MDNILKAGKINLKVWNKIKGKDIKIPKITLMPIFIKNRLVIFKTWKLIELLMVK